MAVLLLGLCRPINDRLANKFSVETGLRCVAMKKSHVMIVVMTKNAKRLLYRIGFVFDFDVDFKDIKLCMLSRLTLIMIHSYACFFFKFVTFPVA